MAVSWPLGEPADELERRLASEGENPEFRAQLLILLSKEYAQSGDRQRALRRAQEAIAVFANHGDAHGEAVVSLEAARLAHQIGDLHLAEFLFHRAISASDEQGRMRSTSNTGKLDGGSPLARLIDASLATGDVPRTSPERSDLVPMAIATFSRLDLGRLLFEIGRLEEAEEALNNVTASPRDLGAPIHGVAHGLLGQIAMKRKQPRVAVESLDRGLEKIGGTQCAPRSPMLQGACIEILAKRAELELELRGDLEAALNWSERAFSTAERLDEPVDQLYLLAKRCAFISRERPLDERQAILAKARAILAEVPPSRERGTALFHTSSTAICALDGEAALAYVAEARQQLAASWTSEYECLASAVEAAAKVTLGNLLGALTSARAVQICQATARTKLLAILLETLRAFAAGEELPELVKALGLDSQTEGKLRDVISSLDDEDDPKMLGEKLRLFSRLLFPSHRRGTYISETINQMSRAMEGAGWEAVSEALGDVLWLPGASTGEDARSMRELRAAILSGMEDQDRALSMALEQANLGERLLLAQRLDGSARSLLDNLRADMDVIVSLQIARGEMADAFSAAERARSYSLMRWLGNPMPSPRDGASRLLLDDLDAAKAEIRNLEASKPAWVVEQREQEVQLRKARDRYDDLLLRLKLTQPGYREFAKSVTADLDQIRAALPPATTLLSYFTLSDRTLAWVIEKDHWKLVELPATRAELASRIGAYRRYVATPRTGDDPRPRGFEVEAPERAVMQKDLGSELFDLLIASLEPYIHYQHLLVVPHDALQQLPFAALYDSSKSLYLAQKYSISALPSASALLVWTGAVEPHREQPLVLGNPMTSIPGLKPLDAAGREARKVAEIIGTKALVGDSALESVVRDRAESLSLLHLASHGVRMARERESFLALAADRPQEGQDGRLEMSEVFDELRFRNHPLVVLSACESGLGQPGGSDEVEGMVRAFLYAGAGAVMATLWPIADEASAILTEKFYQQLAAGHSAAEALRKAQESMIADANYRDPYFWAGFTLTGDPRTRLIRSR